MATEIETGLARRDRLDREMRERSDQMAGRKPRPAVDPLDEILGPDRAGGVQRAVDEAAQKRRKAAFQDAKFRFKQLGFDPHASATLADEFPDLTPGDIEAIVSGRE